MLILSPRSRTSLEVFRGAFLCCMIRYYSFLLNQIPPLQGAPQPELWWHLLLLFPPLWPIIPKLSPVTSHPSPTFPYWPLLLSKALRVPANTSPITNAGAWMRGSLGCITRLPASNIVPSNQHRGRQQVMSGRNFPSPPAMPGLPDPCWRFRAGTPIPATVGCLGQTFPHPCLIPPRKRGFHRA